MNSIARALNNIAISINKLSDAVASSKKLSPTPFPKVTTTSNPIPVVTKITEKEISKSQAINNVVGTMVHISRAEGEAIRSVFNAVTNKGINPVLHDKMMAKLKSEWPVLYKALDELVAAHSYNHENHRKFLDKTPKDLNKTSKDIWG